MYRKGFDDFYAEYSVMNVLSMMESDENLWYPLINPSQYKRALEEFVKYGQFINFPTNLIYDWMDIIMKNTVIIDRITELAGHTSYMPVDDVKDYYGFDEESWNAFRQKLIDDEALLPSELFGEYADENIDDTAVCFKLLEEKGIYDKCQLPDGSDGWSDYGLNPLYDIIAEYKPDSSTPEQVIVIINKALDVTHQRGDLPSAFIQGGSESLSKITNESVEMNDEVIDVYGNEMYKKLTIYDNGDLIGYTDYAVYEDKPYIQMINVEPQYRRKGFGTKMIQYIQNKFPQSEIDFGFSTDDGSKFIEKLPKKIIKNGAYTRKLNRAKELKKWLDNFETHTNKDEMTEDDYEFVRQHTDEWQKIHWEYRDLVNWLNDHKKQKVFIKTDKLTESIEYASSWKTKDGEDVFFTVLKNPTKKEFWDELNRSVKKELRGIVGAHKGEDLFVWDAYYGTHEDVERAFITSENFDERTYLIFDKNNIQSFGYSEETEHLKEKYYGMDKPDETMSKDELDKIVADDDLGLLNEEKHNYGILYHGTNAEFDNFSKESITGGYLGKGFYFTMSPTMAKSYGKNIIKAKLNYNNSFMFDTDALDNESLYKILNTSTADKETKKKLFQQYIQSVNNNAKFDANNRLFDAMDYYKGDTTSVLKELGYDSIDNIERDSEFLVFEPNQIEIVKEDSLMEMAYPYNFHLDVFESLKTFRQRIDYCKERLERIGEGTARIVFKVDDKKVLKIAKNSKGIAQNEAEEDWNKNKYGIFAEIYEADTTNHTWIEMELTRRPTAKEFKSIMGISIQQMRDLLWAIEDQYTSKRNMFDKTEGNKILQELVYTNKSEELVWLYNYMTDYQADANVFGDWTTLRNWGIVERNGHKVCVIVDFGYSEEVDKLYYPWRYEK